MACHQLFLKDSREFFTKMRERDIDLVLKMTKCVLSAIKRKRKSIDIFELTFKDTSTLIFSVGSDQYSELLKNCLDDLIKVEEYELCAEITKIINKKKRKTKEEDLIL
jgi:hypothetical protein